jgi:alpha-1,6-mannosyltransferase
MPKWIQYFLLLTSLTGYILLGYYIERSNFPLLITVYSSLFLIAYILQKNSSPDHFRVLLLSGILFRFCLIFSIPALSDDFYRFVWDGRIQQLGINPFDFTPAQFIKQHSDPLLHKIFPYLNSPDYYSVYPQICQSIFKIASGIGGDSLYQTVIILKSAIFLSELGTILLLKKLLSARINAKSLQLIYVLNPLVIIELSGNIHFEALMIFFVLLAVWLINKQRYISSAGALSLAVQAKLLPLIFIPLLLRQIGLKKTINYAIVCLIITLALSLILLNSPERFAHFAESLRLYYGKFEFNGSFYLLLRSIGQMILSYNPIAVLSKIMIVLALSGMIWVYYRKLELLTGIFWLLAIYLVFSAVVHPWYLTPLVAFSAFIRFRFALLWSALIPLSYYTYSNNPYNENYWITGIEYLIVYGFLIWELKKQVSPLAEMK